MSVAVVTGGSRGLGRQLCISLASRYPTMDLIVISRGAEQLAITKEMCEAIHGYTGSIQLVSCDLSDIESLNGTVISAFKNDKTYSEAFLFSNAGSIGPIGLCTSMNEHTPHISKTFNFNVVSAMVISSIFTKIYSDAKCTLVNISSLAAIEPFGHWGVYCAHKAARDSWYATMAVEEPSLRVLSYSPGLLHTQMNRELPDDPTSAFMKQVGEAGNATPLTGTCGALLDLLENDNFSSGQHVDCYDIRPDLDWKEIAKARDGAGDHQKEEADVVEAAGKEEAAVAMDLNGMSVLVTGGTGSFGKCFLGRVLKEFPAIKRLVVYSRDELKQFEMATIFSPKKYPCLKYMIGNVRDPERFRRACQGIDVIIHAAALKQVGAAEYNPMEFVKTNVSGAHNVIEAALDSPTVKRVVALSTDKSAAPIGMYGATKMCSDKLFVAANRLKGDKDITFSLVRYGNVMGSRGSVIPFFMKQRESGVLTVTHEEMTRFNISLDAAVDLVYFALCKSNTGGEIFVPKIPSYRILQLAEAIGPRCKVKIVGIRPGEKLHEEMVTLADAAQTIELKNHFVICPKDLGKNMEEYCQVFNGKRVPSTFTYNSGQNTQWLSPQVIREEIVKRVDPNFKTIFTSKLAYT